ncbi:MAG TPA: hypothetical protein VGB88_11160 [Alphaproteobacteria bacterium]
MKKSEIIKPFSWGVATGAIVLTIVAFSAGWVVTSGARTVQVRTAWIDGQASICASLAQAHRQESGDVTDLSGYQARVARDDLAKAFAVALVGEAQADPRVVNACSDLLNKRDT